MLKPIKSLLSVITGIGSLLLIAKPSAVYMRITDDVASAADGEGFAGAAKCVVR